MGMQTFKVVCRKGQGEALGNLLRDIAYSYIPCWRPIAYSIDKKVSNILYSEDTILQDMIEFSCNLATLNFKVKQEINTDFVVEHYTFKSHLTSDDLKKGSVIECISEESVGLLDSVKEEPITITIYYRKAFGVLPVSENISFLRGKGESRKEVKVMSSNHTVLKSFAYKVEDYSLDEEELEMRISTKSIDEKELLNLSIDTCIKTLSNFKNKI